MRVFDIYLLSLSLLSHGTWADDQVLITPAPREPIVYLIRHAEKPPKNSKGEDPPGLSAEGLTRAEALVDTFSNASRYNIDFILAEHPKKNGGRSRPLQTVNPLAKHLGLKVHTKVRRDDPYGVVKAVKKYKGTGNILICWEHSQLTNITFALGVIRYGNDSGWYGMPIEYPHKRFDLIWEVPPPYTEIANVRSERVPGLDDGKSPKPPGNSAGRAGSALILLLFCMASNVVFLVLCQTL